MRFVAALVGSLMLASVLLAQQKPADDQPPPTLLEQRVQVLVEQVQTLRAEVTAFAQHQATDAELQRIATAALERADSVSAAAETVRQQKARTEISLPCTPGKP